MQYVANIFNHLKKSLAEPDESTIDDENMTKFEHILDRVTGPDRIEPNYDEILELASMVNSDKVRSVDAVQLITDKLYSATHSSKYIALKVLEAIFYQCGNLVHREICTVEYMTTLKTFIKSAEDEIIKDEILKLLVAWAEVFKHFPLYSAPEDLLKELLNDGIDLSLYLKKEMLMRLISEKDDSRSSIMNLIENIRINSISQDGDIEMQNVADERNVNPFEKEMEKVRLKKKEEHEMYLKSKTISTSSDIKDNKTNMPIDQCPSLKSNEYSNEYNSDIKNDLTDYMKKLIKQREKLHFSSQVTQNKQMDSHAESENLYSARMESSRNTNAHGFDCLHGKTSNSIQESHSKKLPKELEDKKKQRINNDNAILAYRLAKNEEYKNECSGNILTNKSSHSDCNTCKRIKETNQNKENQNVFVTKQLPKEMKKVKESKIVLNNSFQEVKEMKKKNYYKNKSNSGSNYDDLETKNLPPVEKADLRKALILSQFGCVGNNETPNQLTTRGDIEEKRYLEQVLDRSCVDNGNQQISDSSDEEDPKKAPNKIVSESEAEFHSVYRSQEPKDDLQMQLACQMNSSETNDFTEINKDQSDLGNCLICYNFGPMEKFRPCDHRCLCENCAAEYPNASCLICN